MRNRQLWKPYCSVMALLMMPAAGKADVVLDWNAIMQATVGTQPPFPQARFAAITQLAVFEAVNAITRDYKPYLGTITAPPAPPTEAAAIAAAHTVLKNYFPASAAASMRRVRARSPRSRTARPRRRHFRRRSGGGRHDRRARQRWLGIAGVLSADLVESRRMATDARLLRRLAAPSFIGGM